MALLYVLRAIQLGSAMVTVWGLLNTQSVATKIAYGAAPSPLEWISTVTPYLIGGIGFIGQHLLGNKLGQRGELLQSLLAYLSAKDDVAKQRRFWLAVLDLGIVSFASNPAMVAWLTQGADLLRQTWFPDQVSGAAKTVNTPSITGR